MSRDEQTEIEEMAKAVCHLDRTCDECMTGFECKAMMYAKRFYNAGYRKSTELAEEIFEKIEEIRLREIKRCETMREKEYTNYQRNYWEGGEHCLRQLTYWFAELKKKYTKQE